MWAMCLRSVFVCELACAIHVGTCAMCMLHVSLHMYVLCISV